MREMEIRSKQMGYDSSSRQQERIVKLGHKTRIRDGEIWVVTMVMRWGGVQGTQTMWDWDNGVASDELELIKEGLWAQTGNFDRQVDNVARKVWGKTTIGRGKGRNRLSDNAAR